MQFAVLLLPGGFPIAVSRTNPRPPPRNWIWYPPRTVVLP